MQRQREKKSLAALARQQKTIQTKDVLKVSKPISSSSLPETLPLITMLILGCIPTKQDFTGIVYVCHMLSILKF